MQTNNITLDQTINSSFIPENKLTETEEKTYSLARKILEGLGLVLLNILSIGLINLSRTIRDEYEPVFGVTWFKSHPSIDPQIQTPNPEKNLENTTTIDGNSNTLEITELLTFVEGKFRKSTDGGPAPDFMGLRSGAITVIDTEKVHAAGFSCCFHTLESQQEITNLINACNVQNRKNKELICEFIVYTPPVGFESNMRFYNNLVLLHDALPGEKQKKTAKIFWNEQTEKILFPHFFNNENVKISDLVFAITEGDEEVSPFQADEMDFSKQLQFVGIGKKKIIDDLKAEIKHLSGNENFFCEIEKDIPQYPNPLMQDAATFTFYNNIKKDLMRSHE